MIIYDYNLRWLDVNSIQIIWQHINQCWNVIKRLLFLRYFWIHNEWINLFYTRQLNGCVGILSDAFIKTHNFLIFRFNNHAYVHQFQSRIFGRNLKDFIFLGPVEELDVGMGYHRFLVIGHVEVMGCIDLIMASLIHFYNIINTIYNL